MEINTKKFAFAAAKAAAVAYAICALVVAVAPGFSLRLLGWMVHAEPSQLMSRTITLWGFVAGLAEIVVYVYLFAWLLAWFYNKGSSQRS